MSWHIETQKPKTATWQHAVSFEERDEDSARWWYAEEIRRNLPGGVRLVHVMGQTRDVISTGWGKRSS